MDNKPENENAEKKVYFETPTEFMKDVFIVPFNFDNPENEDHAIFVDMQMKHDLFLFAYDNVIYHRKIFLGLRY